MKLVPLFDKVVLKQLVAEETTASGIVLPGAAKEKPQQAEVIAVGLLFQAKRPVILAGHSAIRNKASKALTEFAEKLHIPVINTMMAKGIIPCDNQRLIQLRISSRFLIA